MVCSRESKWLWVRVWLGLQWITLYVEGKLKMQGCNLQESGTDLKQPLPFFSCRCSSKTSKCATAERELSSLVLAITRKLKLTVLFPCQSMMAQGKRFMKSKCFACWNWTDLHWFSTFYALKSNIKDLSSLESWMHISHACDVLCDSYCAEKNPKSHQIGTSLSPSTVRSFACV